MPKTDSLKLECSFIYPQTGKRCLNQSLNRSFCSLHLFFKYSDKNVDLINQQNLLEEKTNYLTERIKRIQYNQLVKHLNKQLCAFVKNQQEQLNYNCQHPQITNRDLLNNKNLLISTLQSQPDISQEDKQKLYSPGYFKNLPTSQLVKLVKKLEQGNSNLNQQTNQPPNHQTSSTNHLNQPANLLQSTNNQINQISNANLNHDQTPLTPAIKIKEEFPSNPIVNNENQKPINQQIIQTFKEEKKKDKSQAKSSSNIIVNRKNLSPKFTSDQIKQLNTTTGILRTSLKQLEHSYDSDATDSSSGGESCDELDDYLNDLCKQQKLDLNSVTPLPLNQKANYKWALERGSILSRWTWLQAQISDLDFKIRQQNEIYKQFRQSKGQISFYSNESTTNADDAQSTCMRALPLKDKIQKRKLIRPSLILANSNRKLARHSTVLCSCNSLPVFSNSCVLCNERYSYIQMIDTDYMPTSERVALLDPSFHSVLSLPENVSLGLYFSKLLKKETVQRPIIKNSNYKKKKNNARNELGALKFKNDLNKPKKKSQALIQSTKLKKKYEGTNKKNILNKNKPNKVRLKPRVTKERNDSVNYSDEGSRHDSPLPTSTNENGNLLSQITKRRKSEQQNAFDINNIVIPYSIASTTRVQKLEYKEIITPKWRITEGEILKRLEEQEENEIKQEENEFNIMDIDKSTDVSTDISTDKSFDKSIDKSLDKSIDKSLDQSTDRSTDKLSNLASPKSNNKSKMNKISKSLNELLSKSPDRTEKMEIDNSVQIKEENLSSTIDNSSVSNVNKNLDVNEDSNLSDTTDISENKSDSLEEDLSDEIFIERHLKCEADERKRFCSFLKNPLGNSRGRTSSVRQRTESTKSETNLESNTIDCESQDSFSNMQINLNMNNSASKAKSPDSLMFDESNHSNQSTSKHRSYSLSSSKPSRDDLFEEDSLIKVEPFEKRNFPLDDNEFNEMTMYLE